MKRETAEKRAFNYMRKHYPLLRTGLICYFTEIIVETYLGFKNEMEYGSMDFKNDSDCLNYSIEINTCDEYHLIIDEYNNLISDAEKINYNKKYVNNMLRWNLGVK